MRIVMDAMCAHPGGITTYLVNMIQAWPSAFPDDELHVVARPQVDLPAPAGVVRHDLPVTKPVALGRPLAQTRTLPRLAREVGADGMLITMPTTTLRHPGVPLVVVVHDLRHELRPDQFSAYQRGLRAISYSRTFALADGFIAISERTRGDLARLHPRSQQVPTTVVYHGCDHVDAWPQRRKGTGPAGAGSPRGYAVAFGHHSNKNVRLVLEGWARMLESADRATTPRLVVVGLAAAARVSAEDDLRRLGMATDVELSPYLDDRAFKATMADAALVIFPSDFEGFGLPAIEAMRLGVPVVVGPDPAVLEVSGGHAVVMADWDAASLADALGRALHRTPAELHDAEAHARTFGWADSVRRTRTAILEADRR